MILGVFLILIAFVLLRFLFTCPERVWNRLGPTVRNLFFPLQQVLYWGALVAGLILTFVSSLQIGFVALGCFLLLYNASVSSMRWKAIPFLGNSVVQLSGIVVFSIGIIFSFIASRKLGFFALAGSLLAVVILNILMGIEKGVLEKKLTK